MGTIVEDILTAQTVVIKELMMKSDRGREREAISMMEQVRMNMNTRNIRNPVQVSNGHVCLC